MVPVKLTDIDVEGVVALQVQGPGLNQLQQLMTIINDTYVDKVHTSHTKCTYNPLHLLHSRSFLPPGDGAERQGHGDQKGIAVLCSVRGQVVSSGGHKGHQLEAGQDCFVHTNIKL